VHLALFGIANQGGIQEEQYLTFQINNGVKNRALTGEKIRSQSSNFPRRTPCNPRAELLPLPLAHRCCSSRRSHRSAAYCFLRGAAYIGLQSKSQQQV